MKLDKRLAIGILPSFLHGYFDSDRVHCPKPTPLQHHARPDHLAFLDGMHGLAAICVYIEHFALPFRPAIYHPFQDFERSSVMQLPIIRLLYSGSLMVCIFFVVSGVALSLRPAELAAMRDWNAVYAHLESSLFRRSIRLFLPALIASLSVLLATFSNLCNAKANIEYQGANEASENWNLQPTALPGIGLQFKDWLGFFLARVIVPSTWRGIGSIDDYADTHQYEYGMQLWTIPVEYWSCVLLFASFIATAKARA